MPLFHDEGYVCHCWMGSVMGMLGLGLEIPMTHGHSLHIWCMYAGVITFHILFGLRLNQNPQQFCNSDMRSLLEGVTKNYPLESVVPQQIISIEDALTSLRKSLSSKMANIMSAPLHCLSPLLTGHILLLERSMLLKQDIFSTFMMPPKERITWKDSKSL